MGWACAGESSAARLGVGEAWGRAPQRADNNAWRRKSPRPFGLKRTDMKFNHMRMIMALVLDITGLQPGPA
jgi:hypothetical protein